MSRFAEYVTSTAFHLTLSRRQIEMLSQLDQISGTWGYISTSSALIDKGLCERVEVESQVPGNPPYTTLRLTEAGRAVIPLLKLAGLYVELPRLPEPAEIPPIEVAVRLKPVPEGVRLVRRDRLTIS